MKETKKINWALIGTGGISNKFLEGLRAAPGGHAAAILSRTRENAEAFAARQGIEKSFHDLDRMLEDPGIDAVYIGVPHAFHRDIALRALAAKKAVLCEKPAALNAAEAAEMIRAAGENRAFFMEALWTRFTPAFRQVREWLASGAAGEIRMVQANFGFNADFKPQDRRFDPAQGGGALLDLGIYPLALASLAYGGVKPERLLSQLRFNPAGSDDEALVTLSYGPRRSAVLASSFICPLENDGWICGTEGRIRIPNFVFAREAVLYSEGRIDRRVPGYVSNGYNYEAEAVMDCLREGRIECPVMPWAETVTLAETMDEVRAQWNFKYPGE